MPRSAWGLRRRGLAGCVGVAALLGAGACSGTVEASYRPPPPPPPSPTLTTVPPTPTAAVTTAAAAAAACGPDQVSVEVGEVQSDANSRAVPLLLRSRGATACTVANPVGIELLDSAGTALATQVQTAELPAGRTAVTSIPPAADATPAAPPQPAAPQTGPPPTGPAPTGQPGPTPSGVILWLQWRAEPSVHTADPATDCVQAASLLLTLADAAPPIPVPAQVKACDSGTVYVSPAEPNAG
jgi:hypothetical protein